MINPYVPDPSYESDMTLLSIVRTVQEVLWLEANGTWNADKEWTPDTLDEVADALINEGLRPYPIPEDH